MAKATTKGKRSPDVADLARRFSEVFAGLPRAYGEYRIHGNLIASSGDSQKVKGEAVTIEAPLTLAQWEAHLKGEAGLGVVPIKDNGTCEWVAIDIDVYPLDFDKLEKSIASVGLPAIIFRTKSGGAHVYFFFNDEYDCAPVRQKAMEVAALLGFPRSEIFPKQSRLANSKDFGNWINMPYFNVTERQMVLDGKPRDAEFFLSYVDAMRMDPEKFCTESAEVGGEVLKGAPPCIQKLCTDGFEEGTRNNGLFAVGVFLKKKFPDDWQAQLHEANAKWMTPPLPPSEVLSISKSLERDKEYSYTCKAPPLQDHCSKSLCKTREFGVRGTGKLTVVLDDLSKLMGDPPIWYLGVDGQRVELSSADLLSFARVKEICLERLTIHIGTLGPREWDLTVADMVTRTVRIKAPEDAGVEGQFNILLRSFLTSGAQAVDQADILNGLPWINPEDNRYYFRSTDLLEHLHRKGFNHYSATKVFSMLRAQGSTDIRVRLKGQQERLWTLAVYEDVQNEPFDVITPNDGEPLT